MFYLHWLHFIAATCFGPGLVPSSGILIKYMLLKYSSMDPGYRTRRPGSITAATFPEEKKKM
jgi:hypothetical protein